MATISLKKGLDTFANTSKTTYEAKVALNRPGIDSAKTLLSGSWESWTAGDDDEFQGFLNIESGRGYVTECSQETSVSILNDGQITWYDIKAEIGLNLVAIPKTSMVTETTTRWRATSYKALLAGAWESWAAGDDDEFQGFLSWDAQRGYVADIADIYYRPGEGPIVPDRLGDAIPYLISLKWASEFSNIPAVADVDSGIKLSFYSKE